MMPTQAASISKATTPGETHGLSALDWIGTVIAGFAVVALLVFPVVVAPTFESMFRDFGGEVPGLTRMVLSTGFAPALALLPLACLVTAFGFRRTAAIRERRTLIAFAFLLSLTAKTLCVVGLCLPIFELADTIH